MVKSLQLTSLLVVCLFFAISCAPASPTPIPPVTEEEMDAAIQQAKDSLGTLRKAMLAPDSSYDFLGLKVRFIGSGTFEDIWVEPVDFYNNNFTVQLEEGVTLQLGLHPDRLTLVPVKHVLDWVIVKKDKTFIGGYTIRLAYEHMTPEEKAEFLRVTGYVMN